MRMELSLFPCSECVAVVTIIDKRIINERFEIWRDELRGTRVTQHQSDCLAWMSDMNSDCINCQTRRGPCVPHAIVGEVKRAKESKEK